MPLNKISYAEARSSLRKNRSTVFPSGTRNYGRMGVYTTCSIKPTFSFTRDDVIYTTGSCFARNVERVLRELGFTIAAGDSRLNEGLMNKYVTRSVVNELKWGLGLEPFPLGTLIDLGDGLWHDPNLAPTQRPSSYERIMRWREEIDGITRRIPECGVFIMTLGLVETWYDNREDCLLNGIPPAAAMNADPERYSFVRQSYEEILGDLNEIHRILAEHGHPDVRILITVSPVPLRATHMDQDAIIANMYSKSVLRAAAEAFVQAHGNVDYFPSYEMVTLSDRSVAYIQDNVHIQDAMVDRIMQHVVRAYSPDSGIAETEDSDLLSFGATGEEVLASARTAIADKQYQLASRLLQKLDSSFNLRHSGIGEFDFHMLHGAVLEKAKEPDQALVQYRFAYNISPAHPELNYRMGTILSGKGEAGALSYLQRAAQLNPERVDYLFAAGRELAKAGRVNEAVKMFKQCHVADPSFEKARQAISQIRSKQPDAAAVV